MNETTLDAMRWYVACLADILGYDLVLRYRDEPTEYAAMCPNCVTPWKCNGPHLEVYLDAMPEAFAGVDLGIAEMEYADWLRANDCQ